VIITQINQIKEEDMKLNKNDVLKMNTKELIKWAENEIKEYKKFIKTLNEIKK